MLSNIISFFKKEEAQEAQEAQETRPYLEALIIRIKSLNQEERKIVLSAVNDIDSVVADSVVADSVIADSVIADSQEIIRDEIISYEYQKDTYKRRVD